MSGRTVESASWGIRPHPDPGGDQPLHGLVVVALEGDAGLEPRRVAGAHHVLGAGTGDRGLDPRLFAKVLESQLLAGGQWVVGRRARCSGSSSSSNRRMPARASHRLLRTRRAGRSRTHRPAVVARSPPARPRPGSPRRRGGSARNPAIACGISVAPAVGKEAVRSRPPRPAEIAAISASAVSICARIPPAWPARAAPAAVGACRRGCARSAAPRPPPPMWRPPAKPPTESRRGHRRPLRRSRARRPLGRR